MKNFVNCFTCLAVGVMAVLMIVLPLLGYVLLTAPFTVLTFLLQGIGVVCVAMPCMWLLAILYFLLTTRLEKYAKSIRRANLCSVFDEITK